MSIYSPQLVTAPAVEPVTLAEAKAHLRVESSDEDNLISGLIAAARELIELATGRSFINTSWSVKLSCLPHCLELPRAPLSSVTSIEYLDADGDEQTLDADIYDVVTSDEPGRIQLASNGSRPATATHPEAVTITYVSGYGAAATSVPTPLRQAILLLLTSWWRNRSTTVVGTISNELPFTVTALIAAYRVNTI